MKNYHDYALLTMTIMVVAVIIIGMIDNKAMILLSVITLVGTVGTFYFLIRTIIQDIKQRNINRKEY